MDLNQYDKFLVNQKLFSLNAKYHVYDERETQLLYVDRPILKMKIDMGIYSDESMRKKYFSLKTHKLFEIFSREFYFYDENDKLIAVFVKDFMESFFRTKWNIYADENKTQPLGYAIEDSLGMALLRRFIAEFKTDFYIFSNEKQVGSFIRRWTITDKYIMDLTMDPEKKFDRRIAIGLALTLDIGELR